MTPLLFLVLYGSASGACVLARFFWFVAKCERLDWPMGTSQGYRYWDKERVEFTNALCACEHQDNSSGWRRCDGRAQLVMVHGLFGSVWRSFFWPFWFLVLAARRTGKALGKRDAVVAAKLREKAKQQAELDEAGREVTKLLEKP